MTLHFLIGGTGNQLFQIARTNEKSLFSDILIRPSVRRLFGHTNHEQILSISFVALPFALLALLPLSVDIMLAKLLGCSLLTEIDLRKLSARPLMAKLFSIGYFQNEVGNREIASFLPRQKQGVPNPIVMHIRGGDILTPAAREKYGMLDSDYYERALNHIASRNLKTEPLIRVFTNDLEHARCVCSNIVGNWDYVFDDGPLELMIADSVAAQHFISSNSTLAFWICRLREAKSQTIAPLPFNKKGALALGSAYQFISEPYPP